MDLATENCRLNNDKVQASPDEVTKYETTKKRSYAEYLASLQVLLLYSSW